LNTIYESPLLKNNDFYTMFESEDETFFITFNKPDGLNRSGFVLCNSQSQGLDSLDYSFVLEEGKKILIEKYPEIKGC